MNWSGIFKTLKLSMKKRRSNMFNKDNKVLFVDDQEEVLLLLEKTLKDENYTKIFVKSASEALDILKNDQIDVIVTDMVMPQMNGLQLLKIIKEEYPYIVRVVLSGFSQVPSILSAINTGDIYRFLTKPWRVNEESKQIIRDALEYSYFQKSSSKCGCKRCLSLKIDKFQEILDATGTEYLLLNSNGEKVITSGLKEGEEEKTIELVNGQKLFIKNK